MKRTVNRRWLIARRPVGAVTTGDFRYDEQPIPEPGDGEILVRSLYFAYDASQRLWMTEEGGYLPPIPLGEPMRAMGIGQVAKSRHPAYAVGDLVEGMLSWQDYVSVRVSDQWPMRVLPKANYPLTWNESVFGVSGLTAYFAVADVLGVRPGDVVVVSAATGATGYLAAGICKALGASKVIGIAGGPEKCKWIVQTAGYDDAIDYKNDDIGAKLAGLCPDGVDAYFDNVGGDILDTVLHHMKPMGRVVICGAMASDYSTSYMPGPKNFYEILLKMLTVKGILLLFYRDRMQEGAERLAEWVKEGRLPVIETIVEGFEKAPGLLPTMFAGKRPGKLLLKVGEPA